MDNINTDSYMSLGWILNQSEDGFFLVIALENMQYEIISHYDIPNVAVYDCKKNSGAYSFGNLEKWIIENPQMKAYFILNFQLAIPKIEDVNQLNFSRDMLAKLNKNLIFCVTQAADNFLSKNAYDFYSYIKLQIAFEDDSYDVIEVQETYVLDKSAGIATEIEIDFKKPKNQLLSDAISLISQAGQLRSNFRYIDALSLLKSALIIFEKFYGDEHPDTAEVYQQMADIYQDLNKFSEALTLYNKALEIREKVLGKDHPDTATTYNNMAGFFENQGDYEKALDFYGKALAIVGKVLGKDHPHTATTYNNIAAVLGYQGDYEKALEFYGKAFETIEKVLGKNHPYTATTYNNMAVVFQAQGDYENALELYGKALAIREKVLGKDHPYTIMTYKNMEIAINQRKAE